jgi:AraC family carnitine catabolism transcriptional activator
MSFTIAEDDAEQIGFLLLPEYPIYALILAIEALRIANQNSGRRLYSWHLIAADEREVQAGNGMTLTPQGTIATIEALPSVIVCAGNQPTQYITKPLLNWLRRLARHGSALGAIDTGTFTLAQAGVLDGYHVTLHWEAIPMFREHFPDIEVGETLFVVDRDRFTCAGGIAALDMMLHLIALRHGHHLAQIVANGLIHHRLRRGAEQQRVSLLEPGDNLDARLRRIIGTMEAHLDPPLAPKVLAANCGVSVRQLERIIRARFDDSPMQRYIKIRLQAARNLLFYGDIPIKQVAAACGFSAPSVLSREFRRHFGQTPREFRRLYRSDELTRFRPIERQPLGVAAR